LPDGGIVIDNPGMRELQLWENDDGVARTFEDLATLARRCRFRDCRHDSEPGCAVAEAIQSGQLDGARLESHRKLQAELHFQQRKADPKIAREDKEKWKKIHKAMRDKPHWL
jgi:ribosome biogenesis GTPase